MRAGSLRQLPVLTREKRMGGIVTLEDIAREHRGTSSECSLAGFKVSRNRKRRESAPVRQSQRRLGSRLPRT
jgi:CBS-domain-containing membrane protein